MTTINNKVQLIGKIRNVPAMKILEGGRKMALFNLVTTEPVWDPAGIRTYDTQYHQLVVWGKLAAYAANLSVGVTLAIEGKLVYRQFMDKGGMKRIITEIHVHELLMIGRQQEASA